VIELRDGSRLAFLARSKSSGRGFSPRRVIFDEAQEFSALAHRAMLYATAAQGANRQLIYTGTVPSEENNSEIWTGIRDVGRKAESKRAAWAEWTPKGSDDPKTTVDPTSWSVRAQANPALGNARLLHETIDAEWEAAQSDIEGFLRERLSVWPTLTADDAAGAFPANVWRDAAATNEGVRIASTPVVALDVRTGLSQSYAIVAAGATDFGYDLVAVARYVNNGSKLTNEEIVSDAIAVLNSRGLTSIVLDKYGENQHLRPLFEDEGIEVSLLDMLDMKGGCVGFSAGILNGTVKHLQAEPYPLTASQKGAVLHNGLWSWKYSTSDITVLRAATAAWWTHHYSPAPVSDILKTIG
jgi:phage terminase large subunit-like protein